MPSQASAAEEQPRQNNHRYRPAQQPQQNSTSHDLLHAFFVIQERKRRDWVPANATETRSGKRLPAAEFQKAKVLPVPGVRHRGPRLGRRLRLALLQKLDRMQIRRADKGHLAIARGTVDGDAHFLQAVAGRVDVVDLVGEVAEITVLTLFLPVPS